MTPESRISAAISVLDEVLDGAPAERVLTNWARSNRYAGSGDRAAIRDLVFDAIRCRRSYAALGGSETGRGLMIGAVRATGDNPQAVFTGEGYAPAPLEGLERGQPPSLGDQPEAVRFDCPDWLLPVLKASLGAEFAEIMDLLRARAPVFLRVNTAKTDRGGAIKELAGEGIQAIPHPLAGTALQVTENARKISGSRAYRTGLVELQDAASQAVAGLLPLRPGMKVLDYCAGGGGKALAMAALPGVEVHAHDADPARMRDIPTRAARAGVAICRVATVEIRRQGPYDLILADAPCSGSGAWRRSPQGKWNLTPERMDQLRSIQFGILTEISELAGPRTVLAYATCSLLHEENEGQIESFVNRYPDWKVQQQRRFTPLDGGDGFYLALLTR